MKENNNDVLKDCISKKIDKLKEDIMTLIDENVNINVNVTADIDFNRQATIITGLMHSYMDHKLNYNIVHDEILNLVISDTIKVVHNENGMRINIASGHMAGIMQFIYERLDSQIKFKIKHHQPCSFNLKGFMNDNFLYNGRHICKSTFYHDLNNILSKDYNK